MLVRKHDGTLQALYVDEVEASRITGIKVSTLRNHRHKRKGIPYIKFCGIKYKITDISEHMEGNRVNC